MRLLISNGRLLMVISREEASARLMMLDGPHNIDLSLSHACGMFMFVM